jgi:hypothetical protein
MKLSVLVLEEKYQDYIGTIRTVKGWVACRQKDQIWLKGPLNNDRNQLLISSLPVLASYELDEQNRLFPKGKLTPVDQLEGWEWEKLSDFVRVEMPVSALPARQVNPISISLVRNENSYPAYALQTSFAAWKNYVDEAPLVRLQALKFVVSSLDEVLIIGEPLPPIPGKSYWLNEDLLMPAGFNFDPPFLGQLLNQKLKVQTPSYILFNEEAKQDIIPVDLFKPADRAVVRQVTF